MINMRRPLRYPLHRRQFLGDFRHCIRNRFLGHDQTICTCEGLDVGQNVDNPIVYHACLFLID
jgi:hypothetical protein